MHLAGNAEERRGCWRDGVLKASCQPASAPCNLAGRACSVTGCRSAHCAMQPRRQSLLGHGLSPRTLRHATSQAKPARSRAVAPDTAPCNLAGKACSVTGCRPIKKLKNKFSYVSELPTKFVFIFFAWLVVFVKKSACIMEKGMVD